jgi:hypothetical protein
MVLRWRRPDPLPASRPVAPSVLPTGCPTLCRPGSTIPVFTGEVLDVRFGSLRRERGTFASWEVLNVPRLAGESSIATFGHATPGGSAGRSPVRAPSPASRVVIVDALRLT